MLNFYEVEISAKCISLIPMFIDAKLGFDTGGSEIRRKENRCFAITNIDEDMNDCLKPDNLGRLKVIDYLKK